ncbi:hypothetical protein Nepgr_026205 [Nepenthes gracilis]|uniref:Uncharacterized protein n=1 Tax=Nepenthes gracilis TaxID=150966 RepID=A0AAD3T987_NEPGR|nr:hypothetical protein Nepgr_026205 [Nepenthes gracilis]
MEAEITTVAFVGLLCLRDSKKRLDYMVYREKCQYVYVAPDGVPILLEQHTIKGDIVEQLWSRDRRYGVCGPPLVTRFKKEVESYGLQENVSFSPCRDIGGHKYAGNVIIFGSNTDGLVIGHRYGHVALDDIPALLEQHIMKGEIVEQLWR